MPPLEKGPASHDGCGVKFASTVYLTAEDMKLWDSLSPERQRAVVMRDLAETEASGLAPKQSMAEIIAEARASKV